MIPPEAKGPETTSIESIGLAPAGIVVNVMKGDDDERRIGDWLSYDGSLDGLKAAFIGIPYDGASVVRTGARGAPDAVRQAMMYYTTYSTTDGVAMDRYRAADLGDVPVTLTDMEATFNQITGVIRELSSRGIAPISIGGDHSIAFPILRGIVQGIGPGKRVGILHFDAHHDLRSAHLGSESSGVPFRKALELLPEAIHGENLVQIGIAEFTNSLQLANYAASQNVTVMGGQMLRDDARRGIDFLENIKKAIEIAARDTDAIYVSVDIDAIDQSFAPGTAAPNPFGLNLHDVQDALRLIAAHPKVVGMDLVEISPQFDHDNMTGRSGASLVLSFLYGLATRPE